MPEDNLAEEVYCQRLTDLMLRYEVDPRNFTRAMRNAGRRLGSYRDRVGDVPFPDSTSLPQRNAK